jgi:hypothetical protein
MVARSTNTTRCSILAWELLSDDLDNKPRQHESSDVEERWAVALLAKLEAEGAVEFRGKHLPRNELAHQLQFANCEDDELGECLLSALMGAAAVDEVYADGPELARLARATRPKD